MDGKALVRSRDGHHCQRCGVSIVDIPSSIHHRKLRSQGGLDDAGNMIRMCGTGTTGCHGWAHHNRTLARQDGWIVYRIDNPAEHAVLTIHGWVLLDNEGGRQLSLPKEMPA